jgi:hypothetical protein
MIIDIKNMLGLFQSHISMQQSTPRGLGTGWQQDPYSSRVGQLLGCKFCQKSTMSFRANISDQMLDTILIKRFEKRSGHQKVLKGEYVNVVYQRVAHITEWLTFPHHTTYKLQHAFF